MHMRVAAVFCYLVFAVISPSLPANAVTSAADAACAGNRKAKVVPGTDPIAPATSKAYVTLPILVLVQKIPGVSPEAAQISRICFGKQSYVMENGTNPGDMAFDAQKVTVRLHLASDLKIHQWRRPGGDSGDQGGIRLIAEPNGEGTAYPKKDTDWDSCAGSVTQVGKDISFDFSKCKREQYYAYQLHLQRCQDGKCEDRYIDPQIINQPHNLSDKTR